MTKPYMINPQNVIDFDNLDNIHFDINMIAHSLALQCRFGGHCPQFYSVAQHSVILSEYIQKKGYDTEYQMVALLHDSAEAYITDIPKPFKDMIDKNSNNYISDLEEKILDIIIEDIGINLNRKKFNDDIMKYDKEVLFAEINNLYSLDEIDIKNIIPEYKKITLKIYPVNYTLAEMMFIDRYNYLLGKIRNGVCY